MSLWAKLSTSALVPVIVLQDAADAVPLAKALLAGGINYAEVTFRTSAAKASIAAIAAEVPEIIVGAGTVLNAQQAKEAVEAGARFLVSPGMDKKLLKTAKKLNVPIVPGAVTPTEIMFGLKRGIKVFKFFPAGNFGGLGTMKSLAAPFPQIEFIPTGGVNANNLAEYLAFNKIKAVGGSWMCPANLIQEKNWDEITRLSKEAIDIFQSVRG